MIDRTVRPRSVVSMLFIGILLGPGFLMLWIGRWVWALVYFAIAVAASLASGILETAGVADPTPVLGIFSAFDLSSLAVQAAVGLIHGFTIRRNSLGRPWYRWIAAVPALLYAVVIVVFLPVRVFLFQPFSIPSSSLFPNLVPGDYVLVSKTAYGYGRYSFPFGMASFSGRFWSHAPERGDIAVFVLPSNTPVDYVKRVIGLPGDRIQMKNGTLWINGAAVPRAAVDVPAEYRSGNGETFWRETLPNGRSYVISELRDDGEADNTEEYIVPADHYFVLGDNRDNSQDSRYLSQVGYVPLDNFIGPVSLLLFNTQDIPIADRPH